MWAYLNLASFFASLVAFSGLYLASLRPKRLEEIKGAAAWQWCARVRAVAMGFECLLTVNMILWIWVPVPALDWAVHHNPWVGVIIGMAIGTPSLYLMFRGMKDAGKESARPSPDTPMYGGIYQHIRHPQALGEFPTFVAIAFAVNAWFLVLVTTVYVVVYLPVMVRVEEADLVRRFGDAYRAYQARTGALFPKRERDGNIEPASQE